MTRLAAIVLATFAGLLITADASEEALKRERDRLKGSWKLTSYVVNGQKPLTDDVVETVVMTLDADGTFKVEAGGIEATTKIDPGKKPKTIDFTFTEGELKGTTALGIYELTDDTFRICRAAADKPRPTEFSGKEGTGCTLTTYKRAK
jgi:uncharacterized protein (TIGR03067 family)